MYEVTSSGEHVSPSEISSTFLDLFEMFSLMVGEIFDMFPSSNASGTGMELLNQSTFLDGRKYFDSMAQISWVFVLLGTNYFSGRKYEWWCMASHEHSGSVMASNISSSK